MNSNKRIILASMSLLPMLAFAQVKTIMTTDLLQPLKQGEPWDKSIFAAPKMVLFEQSTSSGTDATSISKITLAYFTSSNCTGSPAGSGFYTTPDGTSFTISIGNAFGMVAASAWNVGSTQLSIADMSTIESIAVTFKSTNNNTPQSCFGADCGTTNPNRSSFACVPVTCTAGPSGTCTSASTTQTFQLKTTAAIGDPADGGVIACTNGGVFNLVTPTTDSSPTVWSTGIPSSIANTDSNTNGELNTTNIVTALGVGNYAARTCSTYNATGGFTSGWFLPARSQLSSCLYTNRNNIGEFGDKIYWSSTQVNASNARTQSFVNGTVASTSKTAPLDIRCVRAFTP